MTRVRLRRDGRVKLPAEMREKLKLAKGDYLDAEVVDDGVLLKRVAGGEPNAELKPEPETLDQS